MRGLSDQLTSSTSNFWSDAHLKRRRGKASSAASKSFVTWAQGLLTEALKDMKRLKSCDNLRARGVRDGGPNPEARLCNGRLRVARLLVRGLCLRENLVVVYKGPHGDLTWSYRASTSSKHKRLKNNHTLPSLGRQLGPCPPDGGLVAAACCPSWAGSWRPQAPRACRSRPFRPENQRASQPPRHGERRWKVRDSTLSRGILLGYFQSGHHILGSLSTRAHIPKTCAIVRRKVLWLRVEHGGRDCSLSLALHGDGLCEVLRNAAGFTGT